MNTQTEQRVRDRRFSRAGGRRFNDGPARPVGSTRCPACLTTCAALQAGEAEGGWWFVCVACDHMWDERMRAARYHEGTVAVPAHR
jgi:hypothetical protein